MAGRRSAHGSRTRPLGVPFLVLALVLLVAAPVSAQAPIEDRLLYLYVSDDGAAATVFDRLMLAAGSGHTVTVEVPHDADVLGVTAANGSALRWARSGSGTLEVGTAGSTGLLIVSELRSDRPGEVEVRFPARLAATRLDVVASVPDGLRALALAPIPADAAVAGKLRAVGLPLPEGRPLWGLEEADIEDTSSLRIVRPVPHAEGSLALLLGLFAILGGLTVWLFARIHRGLEDPTTARRKMGVLAHLDEMRGRFGIIAIVLVAATGFFFTFRFRWMDLGAFAFPVPWPSMFENTAAQVYGLLARLVVPPGVQVVVLRPMDAAALQVGISVALAVLATFPVLLYQLYAFIAPGLYPRERRAVFVSVPFVLVLFVAGAVFGVWGIAPFIVAILYQYAGGIQAVTLLDAQQLVSFTMLFAVLFGIAFQLPAVMVLLVRIGVTRTYTYIKYWRHMVLIIMIVAGLVTDPTVLSQLIVGAVLLLLYGLGLVACYVVERRRQNALAAEAVEKTP